MRFMMMVLASCALVSVWITDSRVVAQRTTCPAIEVSAVADAQNDANRSIDLADGRRLVLTGEPLITSTDITGARASLTEGQYVLNVDVTARRRQTTSGVQRTECRPDDGGSSTLVQMDSTCARLGVSRSRTVRQRAAEIHLAAHRDWMQPWADSLATLHQLRTKGVRLGVRAADCVYVGDRFDELRGASEAGMRAVWLGVPGAESSIQWSGPRITRPGELCAFVSASATAASMRQ